MGVQTMGSLGGAMQEQKLQSLAEQGSLYSLTLDEFQHQLGDLGKPIGSMNLDELIKSIWTVEANQTPGLDCDGNAHMQNGQLRSGSSLRRQDSVTLSRCLSKKTVDEVWRDIQHKKSNDLERRGQERQPTFGGIILEDFLTKAGAVTESSPCNKNAVPGADSNVTSNQSNHQHANWTHYQLPSVQLPQHEHHRNVMSGFKANHAVHHPFSVSSNPILDTEYSDTMINVSPSFLMGGISDAQAPCRKRFAPEHVVEKTVERRQKRMIKNRESAARSRARKQAYTHELELKVSHLEEENERLRRQKEEDKILPYPPAREPKHRPRRTSSAPL